jgi:phage baseplate assembly protein gpV/phage protein D
MRLTQGLPELVITIAGRRIPPSEVAHVVAVRVHFALGSPAQCVLTWHLDETSRAEPATGDALRLEIGGQREPLFVGEVTVVEYAYGADASREIRVRAYDALHRLRKRASTRLHADTNLADLVAALVEGTGLSVDGPSTRLGDVYQCARSDLDLLADVCGRVGRYPVVDGPTLRLLDLAGDGDPILVELGTSLHSAEVEVSQEPAFRSVTATRWDPVSALAESTTATDPRARAGVSADPGPDRVGGGGALLRADDIGGDLTAGIAQAALDARGMGEVSAVLVAEGNPALRAGRRVRLQGVRAPLEGTYVVTEATHLIDRTGYETTLSTRPPSGPRARLCDQVTLGVVDDVADPEDRGRARVRLVAYPNLVTPWAPVLAAAAGDGKGVVAMPDTADTVLVLLPAGDPAGAIILGGLYGMRQAADAGGTSRGTRLSMRTRDGQQVRLDGAERTIALTDGHGSTVELGPDLLRITAATDVLFEAPGRAMRVRAKTVDFEEAP